MLDRLLGRATLKERIEDLEEENGRLRSKLEAEEERRREAVAARNDVEERANRMEDRIAELEDRVERAETEAVSVDFRGGADVRGDRLGAVLDRLRSVETGPEGALTAMVADGDDLPGAVTDLLGERAALVERAAPCLVYADDERLVSAALRPPVAPDPFVAWDDGFRVDEEWFLPTDGFALALVRADVFAIGEYRASDAAASAVERVAFEGFESDVAGAHSKGGFSQGRFERRRDEQVDAHLERCREAVESRDADALYVVGERTVLPEFRDVADATAAVDATGDPADALDRAFEQFWTVRLRLL